MRDLPVRTCVGCRQSQTTDHLLRVVRYPEGRLAVDRVALGRGAWVCRDPSGVLREACIDLAERRHAFGRALRATIRVGAEDALRAAPARKALPATPEERARMEEGAAADAATSRRD